jgi:hypothetical protein
MKFLIFILFIFSTSTFAWLCPGNFSQVSIGDTIETVKQTCGAPLTQNTYNEEPNVPQEWKYFIMVNQPYQMTYSPSNNPPPRASIRMSVTFVNDKAINITVEDQSITSSSICGPTINTGDSQKSIERSCGKPTFIQKQTSNNSKPVLVTEFIYSNPPPNTFIFKNGILTDRR